MLRHAEKQRLRTQLDIEYVDLPGERIPLAEASVDIVVSTFTLCTILGVVEALQGIGRLDESSNQAASLSFFEHGLSPDPRVRRWQERSEPLFRLAFEGCHGTRVHLLSGRVAPRSNRWTQGIWLHFQSRDRIGGGAWQFRNYESKSSDFSVLLTFKMFSVCKDFFHGVYAATAVS